MVLSLQTGQGINEKECLMQHGETKVELPRHLARQIGKKTCDSHNGQRVWQNRRNSNLFSVPNPNAMVGVVVETKKKRVYQKPNQKQN